jgi:hypothetical protein
MAQSVLPAISLWFLLLLVLVLLVVVVLLTRLLLKYLRQHAQALALAAMLKPTPKAKAALPSGATTEVESTSLSLAEGVESFEIADHF